jgi:outer membrane protein assembly factor BamB
MAKIKFMSFIIMFILYSTSVLWAQNWPCWRGPNGDGTSSDTNIPVKWDSVTNVVWKTSVPGGGYSSPVIWKDKLFLTSAIEETQEKVLFCYDAKSGKLLWQKTVLNSPFEGKHNNNSFASGTPATDGNLIYISFLDGKDAVVAAYDFTGKQIWLQRPGTFQSPHGYSCSPVLYNDKVIINGNSLGDSFAAALSKSDGHIIWKVSHEKPAHSFSTPIIREMAGKVQMIFCGNKEIASYNPDNGKKYWFVSGPSEDFCSSPVYNEKTGLVLVSSAWPKRILVAIKPDGQGDVSNSHVTWQSSEGACYVPSPVCIGEYFFSTMTNGRVHCMEAATGKILWIENLGIQYPSPVLVNGLVYMPNDEGVITVIKPGSKFEYVSKNPLGEKMFASPAISNGKIYLRGFEHLYCIGINNKM